MSEPKKTPTWIDKRRSKGHDFADLVESVNLLVIRPTNHGTDEAPIWVEGSVTVDTVQITGADDLGPRYWQLDYEGHGFWVHAPSGTEPRPLAELLCVIAEVASRHQPEADASDASWAGRFTVSTDPDGRSYLFGKNHPEPYEGFISGGTELFGWQPEAVENLRTALAAADELAVLKQRIARRVDHATRRLKKDRSSDYWRGALVAASQLASSEASR